MKASANHVTRVNIDHIDVNECNIFIKSLKNLLEKDESLVYSLFDFHPLGVGTMVERSPYTLGQLLDILERLENKGFIKENIPNYYIKNI